MTDQEINIAIAECCGWTTPPYDCTKLPKHKWQNKNDGCCYDDCPNYTSDLNAMHEAEKVFDDQPVDTKSMYWDYLCLCAMPEPFPGDDTFLRDYVMIRSTARQRAEAFLRTLGKWKE